MEPDHWVTRHRVGPVSGSVDVGRVFELVTGRSRGIVWPGPVFEAQRCARARAATLRINASLRDDVVGAGVAPIDSSVRATTLSAPADAVWRLTQ